jgi:hypothetical protein
MANLTSKELTALEDQLGFERTCQAKYEACAAETQDTVLRDSFNRYANQHRQNFQTLLTFLH